MIIGSPYETSYLFARISVCLLAGSGNGSIYSPCPRERQSENQFPGHQVQAAKWFDRSIALGSFGAFGVLPYLVQSGLS